MVKDKKEKVHLIKKLQYIADINPTNSLNTLNVNNRKSPNKRKTVEQTKKKQDPSLRWLQITHFKQTQVD